MAIAHVYVEQVDGSRMSKSVKREVTWKSSKQLVPKQHTLFQQSEDDYKTIVSKKGKGFWYVYYHSATHQEGHQGKGVAVQGVINQSSGIARNSGKRLKREEGRWGRRRT